MIEQLEQFRGEAKTAAIGFLFCVVGLAVINLSTGLQQEIRGLQYSVAHQLQSLLGLDPHLDPDISLIGMAPSVATGVTKGNQFTLDGLYETLKRIGKLEPKEVFVDFDLSVPYTDQELARLDLRLNELNFPVYFIGQGRSIYLDESGASAFQMGHGEFDYPASFPLSIKTESGLIPHVATLAVGGGGADYRFRWLSAEKFRPNVVKLEDLFGDGFNRLGDFKGSRVLLIRSHPYQELVDTPVGQQLKSETLISQLNSYFQGSTWLHLGMSLPASLIIIITILLFYRSLPNSRLALIFGSVLIGAMVAVGIVFQTLTFWMVDWVIYGSFCSIFLGFRHASDTWQVEREQEQLRFALNGLVGREIVAKIVHNKELLQLTPDNRVVTMLYVDVSGFSLLAERLSAYDAFMSWRSIVQLIASSVHRHGGVCDHVMGDGILAYFGFNFDKTVITAGHADMAVQCAIELQKVFYNTARKAMAAEQELYPISIGIFTGQVYTGFLSSKTRLLPTIIGYGLQTAKNLQQAADEFKIMVSMTTKDLLRESHDQAVFHQRYYQFPGQQGLVEAYEVDCHNRYETELTELVQYYRSRLGVNRRDDRYPLASHFEIDAQFGDISGVVVNFSRHGIAVELERYLSKGVVGTLMLNTADGSLEEELYDQGLAPMIAEIRWGVDAGNGIFRHGVQIKNFDEAKATKFFETMRRHVTTKLKKVS